MRVAFVSAHAHHDRGGEPGHRLSDLAGWLAARGHDATVYCAQWWDGWEGRFEVGELTYRGVALDAGGAFALRLPAFLARAKPDVVHAVGARPGHVLAARLGATLAGAPLVVDWPDAPLDDEAATAGRTTKLAARAPAALTVPSRLVRTGVRALGADGDDVRVVPNAVDFERIRATEPADGGEIVYSRTLDGDANLESLLLALAEFREYDWRATVVGDGPARDGYERQASDLRIDDRVEFVGERSVDERVALFRNAHVYVQTAYRCPFAADLLWALACGCVGVVEYQPASSAHELVEQRDRGFLATGDTELVDCIAAAGDLPRLDVDDEFAGFDESAVLDRYLDCYREVQQAHGLL